MTPTDPIYAALERLHQYAVMFPLHDTDAILAKARAALAAKPPLTDEQIRDLAEFDFSFDRVNQVDQDKNETLIWECSDSDLIQFARFIISGGQKL